MPIIFTKGVANKIKFTKNGNNKFIFQKTPIDLTPIDLNNLLIYWNFESESITPAFQADTYTVQQDGTPTYVNDGPSGSKAARLTPNTRIILRDNLWNHRTGPYTSFTCSLWIKKRATNSTGQQGVYLGSCFGPMGFWLSEIGGDFGAEFSLNNNIALRIQTQNNTYNGVAAIYNNYSVPLNTWMHLIAVNDFPNKTIKLYLNGSLVATNTYTTLGSYYNNWNGIAFNGSVVGTASSEYGNNYDYAYISLWNRMLNDNEILSLYNNPSILNA